MIIFSTIRCLNLPSTFFLTTILNSSPISGTQAFRRAGNYRRPQLQNLGNKNSLQEFRTNFVEQNKCPNRNEWKNIRNSVLEQNKHITEVNVDGCILGLLKSSHHLPFAKEYIAFLKDEGKTLNYAILGRLFKLYYMASKNGGVTEEDKEKIIEIYRKIRSEHEVFDSTSCENLINGIILTDMWRDSLELLEMIKISGTPSISAYCPIITKMFESFDDMDTGWKLLQEMIAYQKQPKCEVFSKYFETIATSRDDFKENLEKMLEFIGHNEIHISRTVMLRLREILQDFQIKNFVTNLTKDGQCQICSKFLTPVLVTDKEFETLSSAILEKVLVRNDVFLKSTPDEVEKFVEFVGRTAPYDCVIDGLNVAYGTGVKKSPKVFANLVCSVVRYFKNNKKRTLVIGRKHMLRWPSEQMTFIKRNSAMFLANDLSQDDPFLLYATIKSGKNTDFFSRDLMRQHSHLLGPELKSVFKRWQQEHQYSLLEGTDFGKIVVKEPTRYNKQAHKVDSHWHVPFIDEYRANPPEIFDKSSSWLCITL